MNYFKSLIINILKLIDTIYVKAIWILKYKLCSFVFV